MLEFSLNNQSLALDTGSSVRLTWKNPACNVKEFPGDIGMGITIPVNEINRALFGNPERFERYSKENTREFSNFEVRYSGVLLMGGTLIIESANEKTYQARLRSDLGNLGKEHREKYIYDSISFNEGKTWQNKADYDPDTDDYGCPKIFNPEFFKEKGSRIELPQWAEHVQYYGTEEVKNITETEDLTEAFRKHAGWYVNSPNMDGTVKADASSIDTSEQTVEKDLEVYVVTPMLFLNYVLKTTMKDAGFYIDNNFIAENDDLKRLLIYNNYDITRMLFTTGPEEEYISKFNPTSGIQKETIMRRTYTISRDYQGSFYYKSLLPKIKLKEFILGNQNLLNIIFHFRPGRKIVDIIDREGILTGETIDIEEFMVGGWNMDDKKDSTLKFTFEHDKNDTFFADNFEELDDRRGDEREPVQNWDALKNIEDPKLGEIRKLKDENQFVQYALIQKEETDPATEKVRQISHLGWEVVSIGFQNGFYNYGKDEEEEIPTDFSTLFLNDDNVTFTHQKGNTDSEKYSWESFSPRMLFYLGNNDAKYRTNNVALDWERETTGLMESRWKLWSRFWATRQPVNCEADFSLGMLDYVVRNIYKKFRGREGEFIIDEITTEFGIDQIGRSEIKGYKLNYAPRVVNLDETWEYGDIIWIDETIDMDSGLEQFYPLIIG